MNVIVIRPELKCPECGKLFIQRHKLQKYCNFECTQRVGWRNYKKRRRLAKMKRDLFA
jgi:uncharacterized C2H2 Zn-finger protein